MIDTMIDTGVDAQTAYDKLTALGSGNAIAAYFLDERIVGVPGSGMTCPVAIYLHRETGVVPTVGVGSWYPSFDQSREPGPVTYRPHSAPVAEFVAGFDDRRYPALVATFENDTLRKIIINATS